MEDNKTYPSVITRKFSLTDIVVSLLILVTCFLGWKVYKLNKELSANVAITNQVVTFLQQAINSQPK